MSRKKVEYNSEDHTYTFNCPHCDRVIQVLENEIACCIFRCGVYSNNFEQINPHTDKKECDRLVSEDLIFGCGKPFKFFITLEEGKYVDKCDYI